MKARFEAQSGLSLYDARALTSSRELGAYFEAVAGALPGGAKLAANSIMGEVAAALNKANLDIVDVPVSAVRLAGLLTRIDDGTISGKIARDVFDAMWAGPGGPRSRRGRGDSEALSADEIIAHRGLKQISDEGALERVSTRFSPRIRRSSPSTGPAGRRRSIRSSARRCRRRGARQTRRRSTRS